MGAEGVDLAADRALVWVEYLVLMETFDRTQPGRWAPGQEGREWCVRQDAIGPSVAYAARQHRRVVVALRALLGRPMSACEETRVVEAIYERTGHDERVALLAGRSVLDEITGRDLLAAPKPS